MADHRVTVRLDPELHEWLRKNGGENMSFVVRTILDDVRAGRLVRKGDSGTNPAPDPEKRLQEIDRFSEALGRRVSGTSCPGLRKPGHLSPANPGCQPAVRPATKVRPDRGLCPGRDRSSSPLVVAVRFSGRERSDRPLQMTGQRSDPSILSRCHFQGIRDFQNEIRSDISQKTKDRSRERSQVPGGSS